MQDMTNRRIT